MNTRQTIESQVVGSIRAATRVLPQAIRLHDTNLRMKGFQPILTIWPPGAEQDADRISDIIEGHLLNRRASERAAGRLMMYPCCIMPATADEDEPLIGIAVWLEPEVQSEGLTDIGIQLSRLVDPHADERAEWDRRLGR